MNSRKVILYIAMSLDGYIAKSNDDLSFLKIVSKEGEDYGYAAFIRNVDTVIMGRKTYDWVLKAAGKFPHKDLDAYIITKISRPDNGKVRFYAGDLQQLINNLKNQPGKNIFIDGGAEVVNFLMKDHLIDEYIISVIPVFLGEGVRLFNGGRPEENLKLLKCKVYDTGLVQLHYKK